jgi:dihydroorotate dehydrogenase electron transfer subunit
MVRCGEDCLLRRPFSVHQVDRDKLALLFTIVGKGTLWLSQRQTGDNVDIFGPLGNGFTIQPDAKNLLLVGGGSGIAPLSFLNQKAIDSRCSVTLLYGTANKHQYTQYYLPAQTTLVSATADGSLGRKGMVTDLLPDFINWSDQIFACGPVTMYRDMAKRYPQLKSKPVQVSLEVRMGCGLGICYACTVKTKQGLKQVCQDGPVFDLDDVLWDEMKC